MSGGISKVKKYGLTIWHAYSILDVVEIKDGDSVKEKLVKIRNPWGREGYNGPWSDGSNLWTDEYEKQVGLTKANDGAYFMPFSIFKEVFSMFSIAMYEPKWEMSTTVFQTTNEKEQGGKEQKIPFNNPTKQDVIVHFDGDLDRYKPSSCIKITAENKESSCPVPGYIWILDAKTGGRVSESIFVLPWWNTASV